MADTEDGASAASAKGHSDARERHWSEIEPELRPYVDRSLARHAWRSSAIRARNAARWREARAQPLERLDAEALLARTEARILAFWRGDRDEDAAPASWPLNDAQRAAIRRAALQGPARRGRPPTRRQANMATCSTSSAVARARRRCPITDLDLVFFDTTSLFFTGDGGETLGQYGKSKDHRSECKQMVLGMVIDGDAIPVCSEMWPGNTTDVTTLDRVAGRLQRRFGVRRVCLVADAGMISKKMIAAVEARGWQYILGARLRRTKEVRDIVLSDSAPFETIEVTRQRDDPMKLQVKEGTARRAVRRYLGIAYQ